MRLDRKNTQNPHQTSNYRITLSRPVAASKHNSIRSISVLPQSNSTSSSSHPSSNNTGNASQSPNKKHLSKTTLTNTSLINQPSNKNNSIDRFYIRAEKELTFYLGKGNNEEVLRKVLATRAIWHQKEDSTNAFINFKWQQDQKGFRYNRLVDSGLYRSVLNQLEFQECLCNKELLFKNMEAYCQKEKLNLWEIVPPTFVLNSKDEMNMQHLDKFFEYYEKHMPKKQKDSFPSLEKDLMTFRKALKSFFFNCNLKRTTLSVPKMNENYIDCAGEYLWIIKPTYLNRGRGIKVFSKLETLHQYIEENVNGYIEQPLVKSKEQPKSRIDYIKRNSEGIKQSLFLRDPANRQAKQPKERKENEFFDGNQYIRVLPKLPSLIKTDKFLIQKYLQKPMLMFNRKFDLRIWVLVTHDLNCYVFKEGYARLSSMEYSSKDDSDNTFRHLTNNAIQRLSGDYGNITEGNQLSFRNLREAISQKNDEKCMNFDQTLEIIHSQICVTLQSVWKYLNPNNRRFQFQVFGYDFMLDQTGKPWLIEVNNNPCLAESSKILQRLIPRMLNDAFKLTIDQLFWGSVSNAKFSVEGYSDAENIWQKLQIKTPKSEKQIAKN